MVRGLYTASNGMIARQQKLDIVSNNLANVNTAGFKRDGVIVESFESVLTEKSKRSQYARWPSYRENDIRL